MNFVYTYLIKLPFLFFNNYKNSLLIRFILNLLSNRKYIAYSHIFKERCRKTSPRGESVVSEIYFIIILLGYIGILGTYVLAMTSKPT